MEIKSDIINCAFKARAERAQQHRSGERGFAFKPIRRTNLIKTSLPFKKLANTFPTIIVIAVNYLIEKFPRLSREEKKKREDDAFDCTRFRATKNWTMENEGSIRSIWYNEWKLKNFQWA